jgi:hypothetical protein
VGKEATCCSRCTALRSSADSQLSSSREKQSDGDEAAKRGGTRDGLCASPPAPNAFSPKLSTLSEAASICQHVFTICTDLTRFLLFYTMNHKDKTPLSSTSKLDLASLESFPVLPLERPVLARVRVEPVHQVGPDRVGVDALVSESDFGLLGGAGLLEPAYSKVARRKG